MKKVYFISDLHLGATYITDARAHEERICRFLDWIAADAEELIMVGDVLDYWFEYRTVVPRGYVRFFGALARLADAGVKITWFIGNHDIWLFDYLSTEIGLQVVDGYQIRTIYGRRLFISHGDGVGRQAPAFRLLRATFRNKLCQRLYASLHPRWTIPFAHRWSSGSRKSGGYFPTNEVARDPLMLFSLEYAAQHPGEIDYFIFGHEHRPLNEPVAGAIGPAGEPTRMIVLGDWISLNTYATLTHDGEVKIHTFSTPSEERN